MDPGKLNCRIAIQSNTPTPDGTGDMIDSWADTKHAWARITTTGGGILYAAQRLNAETEAVFALRYTAGVTTDNRIRYGARHFTILSVNDLDERHAWLQISAKEIV